VSIRGLIRVFGLGPATVTRRPALTLLPSRITARPARSRRDHGGRFGPWPEDRSGGGGAAAPGPRWRTLGSRERQAEKGLLGACLLPAGEVGSGCGGGGGGRVLLVVDSEVLAELIVQALQLAEHVLVLGGTHLRRNGLLRLLGNAGDLLAGHVGEVRRRAAAAAGERAVLGRRVERAAATATPGDRQARCDGRGGDTRPAAAAGLFGSGELLGRIGEVGEALVGAEGRAPVLDRVGGLFLNVRMDPPVRQGQFEDSPKNLYHGKVDEVVIIALQALVQEVDRSTRDCNSIIFYASFNCRYCKCNQEGIFFQEPCQFIN
jgi:hypothetical protein